MLIVYVLKSGKFPHFRYRKTSWSTSSPHIATSYFRLYPNINDEVLKAEH
jgi:hypothetical protein